MMISKQRSFFSSNCQQLRGFTLVEIIMGTVILSIVVLGMLSIFVAGNKHVIHIRERISGFALGKFFVDPFQMDVRQDQWTAANPLLMPGPNLLTNQTINNRVFSGTYTTSDVEDTDLRRVKANITWSE